MLTACGILVPPNQEWNPMPPALAAQSIDNWIAREVPCKHRYDSCFSILACWGWLSFTVFSATTSRRSLSGSLFLSIVKLGPFSDVFSSRSHLPRVQMLSVCSPPLGTTPLCRLAFAALCSRAASHPPLCYLRASGWLLCTGTMYSHSLTLEAFVPVT